MADDLLGRNSASFEQQSEIIAECARKMKSALEELANNKDAKTNFKKNLEALRKRNEAKAAAQKAADRT